MTRMKPMEHKNLTLEEALEQALEEAKGEAKGRAEFLLRTLVHRGIPVNDRIRELIQSCQDTRLLDQWFDRAWTASTLAEVLGDASE